MAKSFKILRDNIPSDRLQESKDKNDQMINDIEENADETEYLLSSPENAKRLLRSIKDIENGKTEEHPLSD